MNLWQRRAVWLGETSAFLGLGYFGVARGVSGAANALMFGIGAVTLVGALRLLLVTAPRETPRAIPLWIGGTIDVLFVGFLAWHGWFWCAAAWSVSCFCAAVVRSRESAIHSPVRVTRPSDESVREYLAAADVPTGSAE